MYDWASSAFATTILAAVLPVYYSQVAGATLSSEAVATAYWSLGLSLSLLIAAIISPILGTVSDVVRGKKQFLTAFALMGIVSTGLMVLVDTGDWLLASILFVIARLGFTGSTVFYDALLPHVADEDERDAVSARGYALGYLGGGLLLAINAAMIMVLPGTLGPGFPSSVSRSGGRCSRFPFCAGCRTPSATVARLPGSSAIGESFRRLAQTFREIQRYKELFKFLIAFLIYNDAIGTIIGVASIYGAELGFDSTLLILALLLVQFVGIPFSLIFGRLPSKAESRRPFYLAFIVYNLVALPLVGILGARALPSENLGIILGLIAAVEVVGVLFALLLGRPVFSRLVATFDTRRSIILSLIVYAVISVWGYFLNSVIEFWLLAWMVAIVQGGSQALSRSLYASLSPAAKSGEFFGLFGVMEKFSAILGPLLFAGAVGFSATVDLRF